MLIYVLDACVDEPNVKVRKVHREMGRGLKTKEIQGNGEEL